VSINALLEKKPGLCFPGIHEDVLIWTHRIRWAMIGEMGMSKISVQGVDISIINLDDKDYISLTDMVRNIENGLALIEKWLRNKNTIEFLGIWEEMCNPDFNSPEFEGIKNEAGLNRFVLSVKQWVEKTRSKGIIAKAGRYGDTFAHKDIAFEFASWVWCNQKTASKYLEKLCEGGLLRKEKIEVHHYNINDSLFTIFTKRKG
jgi:hypothetical protein